MILSLDPGPTHTGWVLMGRDRKPFKFGKDHNINVPVLVHGYNFLEVIIEKPVCQKYSGSSISETAIEAGILAGRFFYHPIYFITRAKVRGQVVGQAGNDTKVKDAMIERFAPGVRNHGKGLKDDPGFFYGFFADVWQSFALGVVYLDMCERASKKDLEYLEEARVEK